MAKLSRNQSDGNFYTRIYVGGIATRQVHPDAVRYLNKRKVFVEDEIPPDLMSKLRNTKGWLYTKEEYPSVWFIEFDDPNFGMKPKMSGVSPNRNEKGASKSQYGSSSSKRRAKQSLKKSTTVGTPTIIRQYVEPDSAPASSQQFQHAPVVLASTATKEDLAQPEIAMQKQEFVGSSEQEVPADTMISHPDSSAKGVLDWIDNLLERLPEIEEIPMWGVLVIVMGLLLIMLIVSNILDFFW